jgi:hypothetical protein
VCAIGGKPSLFSPHHPLHRVPKLDPLSRFVALALGKVLHPIIGRLELGQIVPDHHLLYGLAQVDPPDALAAVEAREVAHTVELAAKCVKIVHTDTFERSAFTFDHEDDSYICPAGKRLHQSQRVYSNARQSVDEDGMLRYRASKLDCDACALKPRCCPTQPARKILRSVHEGARELARDIAKTDAYLVSRRQRKKVEMLFAHLKRILRMDRLRLRGPNGARDEFLLAATAQNLRKMAKLIPMPATPAPT